MVKPKNDNLHELIHSLDKGEKKLFKLNNGRYSKATDEMLVFDLLNKSKQYDEEKLKKELAKKGKEKINKHLHVIKHHLYDKILDSTLGGLQHPVWKTINRKLHFAEILYHKSLYEQAFKLISKVKPKAYDYEEYSLLYSILNLEEKIVLKLSPQIVDPSYILDLVREKKAVIRMMDNIADYQGIAYELNALARKSMSFRQKEEVDAISELMQNDILSCDTMALSNKARILCHFIHYLHHFSQGRYDKGLPFLLKQIEAMESRKHLSPDEMSSHFANLNNCFVYYITTNDRAGCKDILDKMERIQADSQHLRMSKFFIWHNAYIAHSLNIGDYHAIAEITDDVRFGFETYQHQIPEDYQLIISGNIAFGLFVLGDLDSSAAWLDRILDNKSKDMREDIKSSSRIFYLILQYEMGNYDLIPYLIRSTYRYLSKKNSLFKTERLVLGMMKRLPAIKSRESFNESLLRIKLELEEIMTDPSERMFLSYFDFLSWLESKIQGKSLLEYMQEKKAES